tara:strand:+ start:789 stop:1766 length:978 start_codon:yes stop_codon:yes gene_type:complete
MSKNVISLLFLCVSSLNINFLTDTSGFIKGVLLLDETWERKIYVSLIETIDKKYTVSDDMIIESAEIDSSGQFRISLDKFSDDWAFIRLHVVKKDNPSASLIIGGSDENFCFAVVKRDSKIELKNNNKKPIFSELATKGGEHLNTLRYIENLSEYPNSINYDKSLIEKEFIEEVVMEKLKKIADTCSNALVSLYALHQIDFSNDYNEHKAFYKNYLSKWKNEDNVYFESFRRQLPQQRNSKWKYIVSGIIGIVIIIRLTLIRRKNNRLKNLSVQERKIFELIQEGASNKEISDQFHIELSTVKSHVGSIFSKLKIKSRKEIVKMK